jgi:hypothetical protein
VTAFHAQSWEGSPLSVLEELSEMSFGVANAGVGMKDFT